ncbi:galactoside ABC transporter permease [Collinsella sp. zg1085]|uniref:galactose/methyl galactoside ABC transporter permease MglC n=1 Tax=Collinsella sp. zg1085 TaxID=2844380 RepID=UPI001C0C3031|nr:galactoside ABC transporter permease [Collinsella sp. zg1085]QWT17437.1 galactoside ABC transporter permease [Collinsella sp. zg1085]
MSDTMKILTVEEETSLLAPIDAFVSDIQSKIDALREHGTTAVVMLQSSIDATKTDKILSAQERDQEIARLRTEMDAAKQVEAANKAEVDKLIAEAEAYLNAHFDSEYLSPVKASCVAEREAAKVAYQQRLSELEQEHKGLTAQMSDQKELKEEKYVYKNKQFDAKVTYQLELQRIKDREHEAFAYRYHLIDLLRMSRFTLNEKLAQRVEAYRYTFSARDFFLNNGLYIAILLVFAGLCVVTPAVKGTQLLTPQNLLNILQQASPRMFLALGAAGLILQTGTDLSIGRMVGMSMVASTIIMHQGPNTGTFFGMAFDLTGIPVVGRIVMALLVCVVLCTCFSAIAGFFTARFKMHWFVSTMANMLIIFGIVTYATKGVSFGAIEPIIPMMVTPKISGFPTIILWAIAAIGIVWFIWNKTTFGKNMYAVGGNPEAASVSGINVFAVSIGAFLLAGVLYGFGAWLECIRMVGSGSAAYGQGWEMDAIAACVVGGISFTGGIGKISGVTVGVLIFTALTYALTILGIDTNLQFVFSGVIILIAVTLDCLKYVRKK